MAVERLESITWSVASFSCKDSLWMLDTMWSCSLVLVQSLQLSPHLTAGDRQVEEEIKRKLSVS